MIVLSTDSLKGYGLERIFKFTKEAGYDGIDLNIDTKNYDTTNAEYLNELIKKYELPIVSLQTPERTTPADIEEAILLAKEIKCRIVVIQPPRIFSFKYSQWLKINIPRIRKKEEISVAMENAPSDTLFGFIPEYSMNSLSELKKFKHVCLDTSRLAHKKIDIIRAYNYLQDYLVQVHISNVYRSHYYYLPQKGLLAMESLLAKMKQEGFKGAISIKVKPNYLEVGSDKKVLNNLKEIKDFYEEYFVRK